MLISVRDTKGKLFVKDVLDLDYDMHIKEPGTGSESGEFEIWINKKYKYSDTFATMEDAEERMLELADERNTLEQELKNY